MNNETSWLLTTVTWNKSSAFNNDTRTTDSAAIYVFTPAPYAAKQFLAFFLFFFDGIGLVGCCLIFYFLWKKPRKNPVRAYSFAQNLTMYVRSLCLSDLLSCAVSMPLVCLQMSLDVFQSGWACKIVRYLNFVFPAITINNLVVISLEKFVNSTHATNIPCLDSAENDYSSMVIRNSCDAVSGSHIRWNTSRP